MISSFGRFWFVIFLKCVFGGFLVVGVIGGGLFVWMC